VVVQRNSPQRLTCETARNEFVTKALLNLDRASCTLLNIDRGCGIKTAEDRVRRNRGRAVGRP
jgi:hypothetical protein